MSVTRLSDFTNQDGDIDWKGYKAAQVAKGEICRDCGKYIFRLGLITNAAGREGGPSTCNQCRDLHENKASVDHDRIIRCPHCAHEFDNFKGDDGPFVMGNDGDEVEVDCPECGEEFAVMVHVSYSFTSPKMIEKGEASKD
jgi:hypothetical protein